MNKQEAISLFGSATKLARAIGVTHGAISQWPQDGPLPWEHQCRVVGAALRAGKQKHVDHMRMHASTLTTAQRDAFAGALFLLAGGEIEGTNGQKTDIPDRLTREG